MSHLEKFLEYARNEVEEIFEPSVFNGPDSIDEVDTNLYAYGMYVISCAKELNPELRADQGIVNARINSRKCCSPSDVDYYRGHHDCH